MGYILEEEEGEGEPDEVQVRQLVGVDIVVFISWTVQYVSTGKDHEGRIQNLNRFTVHAVCMPKP